MFEERSKEHSQSFSGPLFLGCDSRRCCLPLFPFSVSQEDSKDLEWEEWLSTDSSLWESFPLERRSLVWSMCFRYFNVYFFLCPARAMRTSLLTFNTKNLVGFLEVKLMKVCPLPNPTKTCHYWGFHCQVSPHTASSKSWKLPFK